jgi:hypothetical protein
MVLKMPWTIGSRGRILPFIVVGDSCPEVFGEADVFMGKVLFAAQEVYIVHADRIAGKDRGLCPAALFELRRAAMLR